MPKKQSIATSAASAAVPARAAKPRTTHSATVKHSKAQTADSVTGSLDSSPAITTAAAPPHAEIAKLAYSFWEARGYQHGYANEDWLRAEAEFLRRSSN